ncbi:MAG TPA: DNA repair protein RadA [Alphaproteobacteria bacterium]|nr:DNA repair protein RadA [Alphaproteobacteria bacterium]
MAKGSPRYVCQECGASHRRWMGRCEACGAWNTIIEEPAGESAPRGLGGAKGRPLAFARLDGAPAEAPRWVSGMAEFDRVAGGGLVPATAVLIGGDPGIGKSTLLLQVIARLANSLRCAYISGEEAIDQVRMRAARMGLAQAPVELAAATNLRDVLASLDAPDGPRIVVIDSIQTMYLDTLDSAPGTVTQVRASAQELIRVAKRRGFTVFMVGHVTKEGQIAGPRVLEHMVDTVLYFEGERGHQFRILRAVKNRFGPTDEIGVFEMTDRGLVEVGNPSALFLGEREQAVSGAAVFAGMEGTRPMLVEIQALVAPSAFATPRRAVVGWDSGRLAMVLAVLEARCGLALGGRDVYLNVAGGLRITEPAADLAVAAALVSSLTDRPVPPETVVFGEIGLSGEVRSVNHTDQRLKEAARLGFNQAIMPSRSRRDGAKRAAPANASGLRLCGLGRLYELVTFLEGAESNSVAGGLTRTSRG